MIYCGLVAKNLKFAHVAVLHSTQHARRWVLTKFGFASTSDDVIPAPLARSGCFMKLYPHIELFICVLR